MHNKAQRVLSAMWSLAVIAVAGTVAYGWWIGDVRGGFLLGFLPASFIIVAANCVALACDRTLRSLSKLMWVGMAISTLLAAVAFAAKSNPDAVQGADVVVAYVMLVLAFPISLLVPMSIGWLTSILPAHAATMTLATMWSVFFVSGYLQWFVLVPWAWRKWVQREVTAVKS